MDNLLVFFDIFRILSILVITGWVFRAGISIIKGGKIEFKLSNPLELKPRWPRKKEEENK